jgi:hypothetical protein
LTRSKNPFVFTSRSERFIVIAEAKESLDTLSEYLQANGTIYVIYNDVGDTTFERLDHWRVKGQLVIPLALRAVEAALSDGNMNTLLTDLRNYAARDNYFDTKNALVEGRHFFGPRRSYYENGITNW